MRIFLILLLSVAMAGCDLNPFNAGCRNIDSYYALCQVDDQSTYLIMRSGEQPEGGGVLEGSIERIGWNDRYILAWRNATFRGDPDGWMKVDIQSHKIIGPISDREALKLLVNNPPRDAASVWKDL
ncbi:hypothetical protein [Xanthomonas massiliensis]|uniref:hypothetical protein n=1 Tax=Xanthomonas massiliensis TaxID=1720302 RepID=UPI0011C91989|nr:hypothetical protein [Xanthomonas massiliensis]